MSPRTRTRGTRQGTSRGLWLGFLLAASLAAAAEPAPRESGFASVIRANMALWDGNEDGEISFEETSRLVPDTTIQGEDAAALAAIHLAQRFRQSSLRAFSRGQLLAPLGAQPDHQPSLEAYYAECLAHLHATQRTLFCGDAPRLRSIHQGLLGDCYFVATLGALIDRDPTTVREVVREAPAGGYDVRFPNGESVHVAPLSDTEIALGSYAAGQGLWLNVLEKAYGSLLARSLQRKQVFEGALDAVGSGGHATAALMLWTGSDPAILQFRPDDAPMIASEVRIAGFTPVTRATLLANLRLHRITTCGTTTAATPPGIARTHLYAVLGFDPSTELVHVWNPWGNRFDPSGPPGVETGYSVRDGHFYVPLGDFIRIFNGVFSETERPARLE